MTCAMIDKLVKSGRKFSETNPPSNTRAELFCEDCMKSIGVHDISLMDLRTEKYCTECAKKYVVPVPYKLTDDIEITFDNGASVVAKYTNGYYNELSIDKICYYSRKGRFIRVKGKQYYLNLF